jgi:hypothetical protein
MTSLRVYNPRIRDSPQTTPLHATPSSTYRRILRAIARQGTLVLYSESTPPRRYMFVGCSISRPTGLFHRRHVTFAPTTGYWVISPLSLLTWLLGRHTLSVRWSHCFVRDLYRTASMPGFVTLEKLFSRRRERGCFSYYHLWTFRTPNQVDGD